LRPGAINDGCNEDQHQVGDTSGGDGRVIGAPGGIHQDAIVVVDQRNVVVNVRMRTTIAVSAPARQRVSER
jgi:hypothetical protein